MERSSGVGSEGKYIREGIERNSESVRDTKIDKLSLFKRDSAKEKRRWR